MVKPIPEGYHTITPAFLFKDARKAIEFYKKAFGATERHVMPGPDGQGVMHAELKIGDSFIMMGEEGPHCPKKSAETLGDSPVGMYLYVKDVDAAFARAVAAGGASQMPVADQFWGDRAARSPIRSATPGCWQPTSPTSRPKRLPKGPKPRWRARQNRGTSGVRRFIAAFRGR